MSGPSFAFNPCAIRFAALTHALFIQPMVSNGKFGKLFDRPFMLKVWLAFAVATPIMVSY
jgi:hypothetical protein